jgi:hypothetical protein
MGLSGDDLKPGGSVSWVSTRQARWVLRAAQRPRQDFVWRRNANSVG